MNSSSIKFGGTAGEYTIVSYKLTLLMNSFFNLPAVYNLNNQGGIQNE